MQEFVKRKNICDRAPIIIPHLPLIWLKSARSMDRRIGTAFDAKRTWISNSPLPKTAQLTVSLDRRLFVELTQINVAKLPAATSHNQTKGTLMKECSKVAGHF
jgi:hypothetical protein